MLVFGFWRFWPRLIVQDHMLLDHMLIIWKNILSQICSRTLFEIHTALGAYSKHAPGAVYTYIMLLEHIGLKALLQIIYSPGPYGLGAYGPGASRTVSRGRNLQKVSLCAENK